LKLITWNKLRHLSQVLTLLVFLYLFIQTPYLAPTNPFSGLLFRLDPLAAATAMLATRMAIPFLFLSLVTLILTLIFGRVWCGWICPLGTILEWTSPRQRKKKLVRRSDPGKGWRKIKYLLLSAVVVLALFGNQTLIFLDPNTILTRSLAGVVFPALRFGILSSENFLYQFEFLMPVLDAIHAAVVEPLFHTSQSVFIAAAPIFLFFILLIALNWSAERFWCRYLCPLGGMLAGFRVLPCCAEKSLNPAVSADYAVPVAQPPPLTPSQDLKATRRNVLCAPNACKNATRAGLVSNGISCIGGRPSGRRMILPAAKY